MARRKQSFNYFDAFVELADYSCKASQIVVKVLDGFEEAKLKEKLEEIHEIEHQADMLKHDMMRALAREFIPPIEIEDIAELAQLLDDVTDAVEDVLLKVYAFNIRAIKPEALEFAEIVDQCCRAMKDTMLEFGNFKKSQKLQEGIILINNLEATGDSLYTKAMRDLHVNSTDPIELITWSRVYDYLERCCDAAEDVANTVENIVMKNT